MDEHPAAYGVLMRLSEPWYGAWFKRTSAPVPTSWEPFSEAKPEIRAQLFESVLPRADCIGALEALYRDAHRDLGSLSTMYGLADYFDDELPGVRGSRGAQWSRELSRFLRTADRMARACAGFGADALRAHLETWTADIGVRGAMFFPHERQPHSWRTVARRLLRANLTMRQIAILETAWLRAVDIEGLVGHRSRHPGRYPHRPRIDGVDPATSVTTSLDQALSRLRQPECTPKRVRHPRLLVRVEDQQGIHFGAVNADEVRPEWRDLTFEPLWPLARGNGPTVQG